MLSEKLADLYAAQGKPSSAVHTYAQALRLDPSPQQRIRLLLTLGEKLPALDRPQEAYEDYQKLLHEFPDYPDKLAIYRKLLPLAQKLDKKADAEKYEAEINRLSPPPPKSQGTDTVPTRRPRRAQTVQQDRLLGTPEPEVCGGSRSVRPDTDAPVWASCGGR